jgi:transient receptor potential cation channel subfamily V protein 5
MFLSAGYVSWGEYPMNFAAVLNQEEIYRLILAKVRPPSMYTDKDRTMSIQ